MCHLCASGAKIRRLCIRQRHRDNKSWARFCVGSRDIAVMQRNCAAGDGETKADPAAFSAAMPLDAEKRLENRGE